jgi:hypothetical protein
MFKIYTAFFAALLCFTAAAQTFTSSDLPILIINTNGQSIPDEPKIMADMGIVYNGAGVRNTITDPANHYNGKIGIEVRGQSSQMFPMKSYSVDLWDINANGINRSLFGLPSESDWVLYAPYGEKTLMHNFLAYSLSRQMGHWAANCRYVEVVINGDYKGIYVFMEKIKRGSSRVNISKINTTDISGDALTGGYIFSIDKEANGWFSSYKPNAATNASIQFSYVYPKETAIVAEQKAYLKSYVDSFENVLNSKLYQDKQIGWRKFADENSFIDYFILNEVSRNVDGYRLSTYLYKDKSSNGGKIVAGPAWDYDLGFRNANYCKGSDTTGWAFQFNTVCPDDFWQIPFWWSKLMTDTAFTGNLRCRWQQLRQTTLSNAMLDGLIDSVVGLTAEARQRHFQRWPVLGQYVWPNPQPIPATYLGEIAVFKEWLHARLVWIDHNMPNVGACMNYQYPSGVPQSYIVTITPNPVKGNGTIRIEAKNSQRISLQVHDAMGKLVAVQTINANTGFSNSTVNSYGWAQGIYYFSFVNESGEKTLLKVVKEQ